MRFSPGCCCPKDDKDPPGECICDNCLKAPCCMLIEASGITNSGCYCDRCDDANGSWLAIQRGCSWQGFITSDTQPYGLCGYIDAGLGVFTIQAVTSTRLVNGQFRTTYQVTVRFHRQPRTPGGGTGGGVILWEKDYGVTKPDCKSFDQEEIPLKRVEGPDYTICDAASSVIKLTATAFEPTAEACPTGTSPLTDCHCNFCLSCKGPDSLLVTIPNAWTSKHEPTCPANSCPHGAYLLDRISDAPPSGFEDSGCRYSYTLSPINCGSPGNPGCRCGWGAVTAEFKAGGLRVCLGNCAGLDSAPFGCLNMGVIVWQGPLDSSCLLLDCFGGSPWTLPLFCNDPLVDPRFFSQLCTYQGGSITVEAI